MREVILVRHGATHWNASRRFQGRSDVGLSEEGRRQARAIAAALKEEPLGRVYASDLSRALETARAVAQPHELAVVSDRRLREFDFGRWEGLTWAEIVAARPHLAGRGSAAAKHYAPEDGESFAAVCARMRSFLDELVGAHDRETIAVVTHAGPLHAALEVLGLGPPGAEGDRLSVSFRPAGITRVTMEGGRARLITLDDVRHLDSAG